ncbi:MAG TPA: hypothetical protein VI934_03825 [Candidatus Nanoarchaeia archaeon]|nr:hypothetical protein [Candidatus Nanoarchaeia archaeon]
MEEGLIRVTPDKEKVKSIFRMVGTTLEMIETLNKDKFESNIVKDYYDAIRELVSALLLLDGFKTVGEGAHKKLIEYIDKNYEEFSEYEVSLLDELRIVRNKISYDGYFVPEGYLERNKKAIEGILARLKGLVEQKLKK